MLHQPDGRLLPARAAAGQQVFALTRSASYREKGQELGAQPIDFDLEGSAPLVMPALDAVVHAAAVFRFSGSRAPFFCAHVAGTPRLLAAAQAAGAVSFFHISAAGVTRDESGSPIRHHADESAARLCAVLQSPPIWRARRRPSSSRWLPTSRVFARLHSARRHFGGRLPGAIKSGQFAFIERGDYTFSTCHVDNVVEAVQCALERAGGGRAYFIVDQQMQAFRELLADRGRARSVHRGITIDALLAGLGRTAGDDVLWRIRGCPPRCPRSAH